MAPALVSAQCCCNVSSLSNERSVSLLSKDGACASHQDALQSELDKWYSAEDDLTAWHALCRAIGVEPLPQTCEQCETGRSNSKKKVQTFGTVTKLRAYTKETGKIFRNTLKQEGGNVVLRHLLRRIFEHVGGRTLEHMV
ncbi:hypothetical protein LARI1_G009054 [Lachnellula arida]|uniref:Uncharacterized protein n=1 Tax=Lachnellula arida TaxID=1316785 RepID=A0A8T9B3L4_9HELO|nr:hypothetical protein LARI1_G009054 [Lachnellula arida]